MGTGQRPVPHDGTRRQRVHLSLEVRDVRNSAHLVVGQALQEHREEGLHVLDELLPGGVVEGAHRQQRLLVHRGAPAGKHPQQHLQRRWERQSSSV